jgi:hypothetical protein
VDHHWQNRSWEIVDREADRNVRELSRRGHAGTSQGYVDPSWGYVGPACGPCWAIWGLCCASWRPFWSMCWAMLTHFDPQDRKNEKATKHRILRGVCAVGGGPAAGRAAPLSYREERTAVRQCHGQGGLGPLAGFKGCRPAAELSQAKAHCTKKNMPPAGSLRSTA